MLANSALVHQAIESIAVEFKIDAMMVEAKMFNRQMAIEGAEELLRRAVAKDRYDVAISIIKSANHACQKSPATRYRKQVRQWRMEVSRLQKRWLEASVAMKTLESVDDDPLANLTVGRWLWFQKGNVQQGLSHLAKCNDTSLRQLAQRKLTEQPTESETQLILADAWWKLAQTQKGEEKDSFILHAAKWYEEVHPTLPGGLAKVRIEKRLKEVAVLKHSLAKSLTQPPVGTHLKP